MRRLGLEYKVGIFVIAALGILVFLVVKAGDFQLKPGYLARFVFDFVSGIDAGSPVRLAGVNVGEVKEIRVVRNAQAKTQAEVIAWLARDAYVEEDAQIRINSMGLLGEKYIEIVPGTGGTRTISSGSVLMGQNPVGLEEITDTGGRLLHKMEYMVDNLNDVVTDPEFKVSVKNTFGNADKLTQQFLEMIDDLKDSAKSLRIVLARLRDGEGTMGRLFKDDTIAKDLEAFVKEIKAHPWKLLKRN